MNRLSVFAILAFALSSIAAAQTGAPVPVIASISPNRVVAGSPDTVITVTGSNFTPGDVVALGEPTLPTTYVDSTHLTATMPGSYLLTPRRGYLMVYGSLGWYSNSVPFDVTIPFTTPPSLPPGIIGVPYSQQISINSNGSVAPYNWTVSAGTLPPGLNFDPETVTITGTPTTAGAFSFTIQVEDSSWYYVGSDIPVGNIGEQTFAITISPPQTALNIWFPATLPDGAVGRSYGENLYANGGKGSYTWSGTSMPPGLTLSSVGSIVGTPTQAGTFTFTATVEDEAGASASRKYSINVAGPALQILTTSPLPGAMVGAQYSQTLAVKGGQPPYLWTVNAFPPGLRLDGSTGAISGAPTTAGTFKFTAMVADSARNTASRDFVLVASPALSITTTALASGNAAAPYSQNMEATGGAPPYTWWARGLPSPLAIDAATGTITGTPAAEGSATVSIIVTDSAKNSATRDFTLTINTPLLDITTTSLADATAGTAYSQALSAVGGKPPYSWSVTGPLPSGVSLNSGTLSGTPSSAGAFALTAKVMDSAGATATKALTLTVRTPPLPQISLGGAGSANPAEQVKLNGSMGAGYPLRLAGQLQLAFTPDAISSADDPAIQFATGGRTFSFTVEPNSSQFPEAGLQTGTVAGTIVITMTHLDAGGADVTPTPPPTQTIVVNRRAPTITSIAVVRTGTGFEVQISGYSTPREVTQARFTLTAAPGSSVQTADFTVPVSSVFTTWYNDSASKQFGSMFRYVQPFNVQGGASGLASVTVTLSNSIGTSQPATANF